MQMDELSILSTELADNMHIHFVASQRPLIDAYFPNMETVQAGMCILMAPRCTW